MTKIANQFQDIIKKEMERYQLCVVHNQSVKKGALSLLFMSLADQNFVVLDSRQTAEKTILKIELLKEEYNLPGMWFILNKSGYNPSIFSSFRKMYRRITNK